MVGLASDSRVMVRVVEAHGMYNAVSVVVFHYSTLRWHTYLGLYTVESPWETSRHHRLELFKVDCSALLAFALSLALILYMGEATGKSIPRIDIPSLGLCFATSQAVVIGVVHRRRRRGTYLLIWHSSAILAL